MTISTVLTGFVTVIGVAFLRRWIRPIKGEGHVEQRETFTLAWPLLVTNLSIYILGTGADSWVLGAFRPQSDVALYGEAARLMLIVGTPFVVGLSAVVRPIISELHAQGKKRELERSMRAVATLAGVPAIFALVAFLLAGLILAFLFGDFYREAATVLAVAVDRSTRRRVDRLEWRRAHDDRASEDHDVCHDLQRHAQRRRWDPAASRYGRVGLAIATGSAPESCRTYFSCSSFGASSGDVDAS